MAGENGVTVLLMLLIAQHLHRFLAPARLAEEQFLLSRSGGSCVRRPKATPVYCLAADKPRPYAPSIAPCLKATLGCVSSKGISLFGFFPEPW